jgi:hypothetical protein
MKPMRAKSSVTGASAALLCCVAFAAYCGTDVAQSENSGTAGIINAQRLAKIIPGQSTKAELESLLGAPWRVVQFNDCGEAMDDQADETWEYRGGGTNGAYRVHVEFDDHGIVHLIAKIPNNSPGGKGTTAKTAPVQMPKGMSM